MSRQIELVVSTPQAVQVGVALQAELSLAKWMTMAAPNIGPLGAPMVVAWINNHESQVPSGLRLANKRLPARSKAAQYLMVSFIDLVLNSDWMEVALSQLESPLRNEPDEVPPKSLDMWNASIALVPAPSASSTASAATPSLPAMVPLGTSTSTPRPPPAPRELINVDGTFEQVLAETTAPAPPRLRVRAGVKEMPKSGAELEADATSAPAFGTRARTQATPTSSAAPSLMPTAPSTPLLPDSPRRSPRKAAGASTARAPSPRISSPQPSRRAESPDPSQPSTGNAATTTLPRHPPVEVSLAGEPEKTAYLERCRRRRRSWVAPRKRRPRCQKEPRVRRYRTSLRRIRAAKRKNRCHPSASGRLHQRGCLAGLALTCTRLLTLVRPSLICVLLYSDLYSYSRSDYHIMVLQYFIFVFICSFLLYTWYTLRCS